MARTPSSMRLPLGSAAPDFALPDPCSGRIVRLADFASAPALVVAFISNHCPFVQHIRAGLAAFGRDAQARGAAVIAIGSNSVLTHPEDGPERIPGEVRAAGYTFPYLFDETQEVAKAYYAACTPDFFLFDAARRLAYRGQFDDSRPGNGKPVTGASLRAALEAVLSGRPVPEPQLPSLGCNIKWHPGREPAWWNR
ncbi:MAG: thioredoxin family protein [Planctomycetota bacterium]|nr:thioredoxin family protein [Planctomycetota bacterium]